MGTEVDCVLFFIFGVLFGMLLVLTLGKVLFDFFERQASWTPPGYPVQYPMVPEYQEADSGQGAFGFPETEEPRTSDSDPVSENELLKDLEVQIERAKAQVLRGM